MVGGVDVRGEVRLGCCGLVGQLASEDCGRLFRKRTGRSTWPPPTPIHTAFTLAELVDREEVLVTMTTRINWLSSPSIL